MIDEWASEYHYEILTNRKWLRITVPEHIVVLVNGLVSMQAYRKIDKKTGKIVLTSRERCD